MNPYQTIYNNSGAPVYQPTWGYTDLFAHVVDWDSELPLGYTRQQYNEERALAAESMWKSPLLGLNTFALGTVASHVAFGSPLQNLSRLVGGASGSAAFNAGFGGPANLGVSRWEALQGYSAARATGDLNAINAARQNIGLVNTQIAAFNAQTSSFWGRVGSLSRGISAFKDGMTEATASIMRGGFSAAGSMAGGGVRFTGGLAEEAVNLATHGTYSSWLQRQGQTLYDTATASGGWMQRATRQLSALAGREAAVDTARAALSSAETVEAAAAAQAQVARAEHNLARLGGGWRQA
jgi:hypothetical protein